MPDIQLSTPIRINGAEVGVMRLRRPKVRDLERMDHAQGGDMEKSILLLASLAEWTPDQIRDLDAADFMAASQAVEAMLGKPGPGSGS